MPRVAGVELFELDLPFRHPFRHAAADRAVSTSLFMRCVTDDGHCGYGETLPRAYVTGEDRQTTFDLLAERILPRVLGMEFGSFEDVYAFLVRCDGRAPQEWLDPQVPQHAAWCLVDLALLDSFGRAFGKELGRGLAADTADDETDPWPPELRYSLVLSSGGGRRRLVTLLKARVYGLRDVKLKIDGASLEPAQLARRILGPRARLRADSNMAWSLDAARTAMARLAEYGVESFEQPVAADDLDSMARLVAETGLPVMADESFHDAASLERLIATRACTGVNVRIAKCGGLVAALARCRRALDAGLTVQIGCQVGETSHMSAAQMVLVRTLGEGVRYLEGCFGERLLAIDPVEPLLQFRRGGRPPPIPRGPGFGTDADMVTVEEYSGRRLTLGEPVPRDKGESDEVTEDGVRRDRASRAGEVQRSL
jgi:L-Ala-D/L-Glu epimerase